MSMTERCKTGQSYGNNLLPPFFLFSMCAIIPSFSMPRNTISFFFFTVALFCIVITIQTFSPYLHFSYGASASRSDRYFV